MFFCSLYFVFFFQAEDGIRDPLVTGVQTCALPISGANAGSVSVQVETGNHAALKALIGAAQNQVFALGAGTRVLIWSHGVPHLGNTKIGRASCRERV